MRELKFQLNRSDRRRERRADASGLDLPRSVYIFFAFVMAGYPISHARAEHNSNKLTGLLTPLAAQRIAYSAIVVDAVTGDTLFAANADEALIPASNAKLFVMAAAIDTLGPDFAFKTSLFRSGQDLLIRGSGDPGFGDPKIAAARGHTVTTPFQNWAGQMQSLGAKVVPGDLILDESIFDPEWFHPHWKKEALLRWYTVPIGALNLNNNCIEVTLRPPSKDNNATTWDVVPPNGLVEIQNLARIGKGEPALTWVGPGFQYKISGKFNKVWPFSSVGVPDPGALFGDALQTVLKQQGLSIQGGVRRIRESSEFTGPEPILIAEHQTSLAEVLSRIGKDSQNMFAECLAKRLGYEWAKNQGHASPKGSWSSGREGVTSAIHRLTSSAPVAAQSARWDTWVWDDASGLSRMNRASARQLAAVLTTMHNHPQAKLFADSLSVAGVDGSLSKRSQLKSLSGSLVGKTGTLDGVSSLSGYLDTKKGRRLAFAILLNQEGKAPKTSLTDTTSKFCQILNEWESE